MPLKVHLLPDAVFVQRFQSSFFVLSAFLVQVLETLPGTQPLLNALLGHVQFPAKANGPFSSVIHKQHRVAVVALERNATYNRQDTLQLLFPVCLCFEHVLEKRDKVLTAATMLFSVMKVTHRRGRDSEDRLVIL